MCLFCQLIHVKAAFVMEDIAKLLESIVTVANVPWDFMETIVKKVLEQQCLYS